MVKARTERIARRYVDSTERAVSSLDRLESRLGGTVNELLNHGERARAIGYTAYYLVRVTPIIALGTAFKIAYKRDPEARAEFPYAGGSYCDGIAEPMVRSIDQAPPSDTE